MALPYECGQLAYYRRAIRIDRYAMQGRELAWFGAEDPMLLLIDYQPAVAVNSGGLT